MLYHNYITNYVFSIVEKDENYLSLLNLQPRRGCG